MNGTYSSSIACTSVPNAVLAPNATANGTRNAAAQAAAILPKWRCQKTGATSGKIAIDSRIPANGTAQSADSAAPSSVAADAGAGDTLNAVASAMHAQAACRFIFTTSYF